MMALEHLQIVLDFTKGTKVLGNQLSRLHIIQHVWDNSQEDIDAYNYQIKFRD
jgi:hypothetical protein